MRYSLGADDRAFLTMLIALGMLTPAWAATATPIKPPILTVHIKGYTFVPKSTEVRLGDTVTFVNDDDDTHTVTATDGAFDSGDLAEKARFSYTFSKPGTYNYHCKIHSQMTGSITARTSQEGNAQ